MDALTCIRWWVFNINASLALPIICMLEKVYLLAMKEGLSNINAGLEPCLCRISRYVPRSSHRLNGDKDSIYSPRMLEDYMTFQGSEVLSFEPGSQQTPKQWGHCLFQFHPYSPTVLCSLKQGHRPRNLERLRAFPGFLSPPPLLQALPAASSTQKPL